MPIARRSHFSRDNRQRTNLRINERIRISPVLLIDENDNKVGEVPTHQALARARDLGLDLVEVAPDARPPVCRIMDYGKFKYEQSKKERATRAKSKTSELKEVRLGRSLKIDPHDVAIRMKKAREFLMEGDKVQIVQNFRGREMQHQDRGRVRMQKIIEDLSDISKVEVPPRMMGRRMSMILGPDKAKIEHVKRRVEKEKAAAAKPQDAAGGAKPDASKEEPPAAESAPQDQEKAKAKAKPKEREREESPGEPVEARK